MVNVIHIVAVANDPVTSRNHQFNAYKIIVSPKGVECSASLQFCRCGACDTPAP